LKHFFKNPILYSAARATSSWHRGGREVYLSVVSEHVRLIKIRDSYMLSMCVSKDGGRMYVCLQWGLLRRRKKRPCRPMPHLAPFLNDSHVVVLPIVTIVTATYPSWLSDNSLRIRTIQNSNSGSESIHSSISHCSTPISLV
jgi:hypothetical protein